MAECNPFPVIRLGRPVSNVWLLPRTEIGPVLVDTGYPLLWPFIHSGLRQYGLEPRDISAIVLTHHHSDHAGNAFRFQELNDIPIYAHRMDARILKRQRPLPRLPVVSGIAGLFCLIENYLPARLCDVKELEDGDVFAGLAVIWVPGHTEGSIFLYHEPSATLFTGDSLLNGVPPLTIETRLCLPHRPFCIDYIKALDSLESFLRKDLTVRRLCAGHGPPREGSFCRELQDLLSNEHFALRQGHTDGGCR